MTALNDVLKEVAEERARQEAKWGEQNHHPFAYGSILGEEFGEVCKAALHMHFRGEPADNYREELIQTAAVAVAMVEALDRNKWQWDAGLVGLAQKVKRAIGELHEALLHECDLCLNAQSNPRLTAYMGDDGAWYHHHDTNGIKPCECSHIHNALESLWLGLEICGMLDVAGY